MSTLWSLLCAWLLVLHPAGQEPIVIDVARDFPGLVEAYESAYEKFYEHARFSELHGKTLARDELARLQAEWVAARRKGDGERDRIEQDPEAYYLYHLDRRLKRQGSYFRDLETVRVDAHRPFYLFVQRSKKRGFERFHETVASFYGPWLRELLRLFESEYATPLGLSRRREHGAFALLVLTDRKAYDTYYASQGQGDAGYFRAHYDPELQLGVTYEEPGSLSVSAEERRAPALHEMVHAFQYAYGSDQRDKLQVTWFAEGLAEYLSHHDGDDPSSLGERPIDGEALRRFVEWASEPARASALFPFEELAQLRGYADAAQRAHGRAKKLQLVPLAPAAAVGMLYPCSYLWMHFLHHADGGKYRDGIHAYVGAALAGTLAERPLAGFFGGVDPAALDAAFMAYVREEWKRSENAAAAPELALPRRVELGSGRASSREAAAPVAPPLTLEVDLELTAALGLARSGALAAATEALRGLVARAGGERERVQRELVRMEAALDARTRFFEQLVERRDQKLRLPSTAPCKVSEVDRLEGHTLKLGKNIGGLTELTLETLPPAFLVAELGDEKRYDFRAGWALGYLQVLAGDPGWQRHLARVGSPEAQALAVDAAADLPARLALAVPARRLVELAGRGEGANGAESRATFEGVRDLLKGSGSVSVVASRRQALIGLARGALARLYDERKPEDLLEGRWEELGADRVRLSYGFDSPDELRDFEVLPYQDDELPEGFHPTEVKLDKSALVALGTCWLWNHVDLAAPLELVYEFTEKPHVLEFQKQRVELPAYLWVGLLAQAYDDCVAIWELNGIFDLEPGKTLRRPPRQTEVVPMGKKFKLVVTASEAGPVEVMVNGTLGAKARCRPDRSGKLFFQTIGCVELHSVSVTGQRTPETFAHWREAWIDQELAAAGLK